MRVNDDYPETNVKREMLDRNSILSFWKKMLLLRKDYADLFIRGTFKPLDMENEQVLTFEKKVANRSAFVVLNFTDGEQPFPSVPALDRTGARKLIGNYDGEVSNTLKPFEGVVFV
jgi:glycosidase